LDEILPGVWHWTTPNRKIRNTPVSSYGLDEPGVFIDPLIPGVSRVRLESFDLARAPLLG
jgi:hypothetical protein